MSQNLAAEIPSVHWMGINGCQPVILLPGQLFCMVQPNQCLVFLFRSAGQGDGGHLGQAPPPWPWYSTTYYLTDLFILAQSGASG